MIGRTDSTPERLLSLQEVADWLDVSRTTLYEMVRRGRIPGIKIGGAWRFKREEVDKWLTEKAAQGGPQSREDPFDDLD